MNSRNFSGKSGSCDSVPSAGSPSVRLAAVPRSIAAAVRLRSSAWSDRSARARSPVRRPGSRRAGSPAPAAARRQCAWKDDRHVRTARLLQRARRRRRAPRRDRRRRWRCLHHRGPDETGVEWSSTPDVRRVFAHKRLSIIDVELSHEPLRTRHGPTRPLPAHLQRRDLQLHRAARGADRRRSAPQFATHGDAEVIVAGYHYWGEQVLTRLRGMFAFVIWDRAGAAGRSAPATRSASSRCTTCETADGALLRQREEGAAAVRAVGARRATRASTRPTCRTT